MLLGTEQQLNDADAAARSEQGGWKYTAEGGYDDPGTTYAPNKHYYQNENISFVNTDRMNSRIMQNIDPGRFRNPSERLAFIVMHEAGHPLLNDHPFYDRTHIPGTIMQQLPKRDTDYDSFMIERLLHIYGPQEMKK